MHIDSLNSTELMLNPKEFCLWSAASLQIHHGDLLGDSTMIHVHGTGRNGSIVTHIESIRRQEGRQIRLARRVHVHALNAAAMAIDPSWKHGTRR